MQGQPSNEQIRARNIEWMENRINELEEQNKKLEEQKQQYFKEKMDMYNYKTAYDLLIEKMIKYSASEIRKEEK